MTPGRCTALTLALAGLGLVAGCSGEISQLDPEGAGGNTSAGAGGAGGINTSGAAGGGDTSGGGAGGGAGGVPGRGGTGGNAGAPGYGGDGGGTAGAPGRGGTGGGVAGSPGRGGTGGGVAGSPGRGGATATGGSAPGGSTGAGDPAGYVPALVGVGYGGIRIVSRDGGKTWGDRAYATVEGGDDKELLRAVAYGKGLWIATGWKLVTSTDGVHWTDRGLLTDGPKIAGCNIVEGLAYNAGSFFAACTPWDSPSVVFRSSDGLTWTKHGTIGDTGGHLFLTYRGGKFVAYGDSGTSYQSTDAITWTVMSAVNEATYCQDTYKSQSECHDSSWFDGTWLRADWQGIISRSTDGKSYSQAYKDDKKNTLYQSRAIAAGYVAP